MFICFSSERWPTSTKLDININNQSIEQISEVKYYSLMLDPLLKFDKHVKKMVLLNKLYIVGLITDCLTCDAVKIFMDTTDFSPLVTVTSQSQAIISMTKQSERSYCHTLKILGKRLIRSHHCHAQF